MGAVFILASAISGFIAAAIGYTLFGAGLPLSLIIAFGSGPAAALFLLAIVSLRKPAPARADSSVSQPS